MTLLKIDDKIIDISIYLSIISVILFTFLTDGYIFLLDAVPKISIYQTLDLIYGKIVPTYGGVLPLNMVSMVTYAEFFQKIMIFVILLSSGYLMYSLTGEITSSRIVRLYAGILYMINPYTYVRIMTGHWPILFAYAILPLLLKIFVEFLENNEKKNRNKYIVKFVFLMTIVSFNIHILVIAIIAMTIIFLFWVMKNRNKCIDTTIIKNIIISGIIFVILNIYWVIPLSTAKNTPIDNIGNEDFTIFSPDIKNFSDLFDIISMHGFWKDDYLYTKDFLPGWQILYLIILLLTITGFISYYKDKKIGFMVKSFATIGILGFILASGIRGPFSDIIYWLFDNTILKGFRDSYKFIAMMVLPYSILGGLGITKIEEMRQKRKWIIIVITIVLIIPFIYSFTFFNGFAGQIKPTDYPNDWYEANNFLNDDRQDFKILFFPWHGYMSFGWVQNKNKVIRNPSQYFFNKETISGTNLEIGSIYREDNSLDQLYIDSLLDNRKNITNFGELISILNVKYVILANESDYRKYSFLFKQTDLELIKETKTLYVFRNKNDVTKIYQTDDITNINSEKIPLNYEKINPVDYKLKGEVSKRYIVFTEPYSEDWKLDGKDPIKAYGTVNAYENNGKEIRFERFYRINLPSYIISLATFGILMILYFDLDKKILKRRDKI